MEATKVSSEILADRYRQYVLGVLTATYTLNLLDRGLVILLLEPIKADLRLSDSQLGFITGIAFGLFYAVLGIPIARLADRGNRSVIASMAMALWGVTVMCCLWVGNFYQLAIARVAAGIGEAGGMPPTYSLLADYYHRPVERTKAMTIYMLASPLSALVSFVVGSWLNALVGWRWTFFIAGLFGLLLAPIFLFTVKETRNTGSFSLKGRAEVPQSLLSTAKSLVGRTETRHLSLAIIGFFTLALGMAPWYAAFLMRSHGMKVSDLGITLGPIFGIAGIIGVYAGGKITTMVYPENDAGQMTVTAIAFVVLVPCFAIFLLAPGIVGSLLGLILLQIVFNFFFGPTFSLLQRLVPADQRATALALVMLVANLVGMGLGPQLVGVLSDFLHFAFGQNSLRYAMLATSVISLFTAYEFMRVARALKSGTYVND